MNKIKEKFLDIKLGRYTTMIGNYFKEILEIEDFAFFYCKKMASITFTNAILRIGDNIFYGCDNLKTINIPVGMKEKFVQLLPDFKVANVVAHYDESAPREYNQVA